jgi:diamine N-acetyltransferase
MPEILPVTKDNWQELIDLKVREDQTKFVASNLYSIAEAQFGEDIPNEGHWEMFPYGIFDQGKAVGFLMIAYNFGFDRFQGFVQRLMVDEKFQGKGYGRFGMDWILDRCRSDTRIKSIAISYEPHNEIARKLYASVGFVETGEIMEGEALAVLNLR